MMRIFNVLSLECQSKAHPFARIEVDVSGEYSLQRKIIKVFPGDNLEIETSMLATISSQSTMRSSVWR